MSYNNIGLLFIIIAGIYRFKIKGDLTATDEVKNIDTTDIGRLNDTTFSTISNEGVKDVEMNTLN